jgi:ABC-type antimicrobial peptide transport system permease subunit
MTDAGLQALIGPESRLDPNVYDDYVLVKWAKGANAGAAGRQIASAVGQSDTSEAVPVTLPAEVTSLSELRSLPLALGVFFALLAAATVAHALVTTVRRRRQELAVLRSIGFTRGQTRIAIAWQATLIAVAGVIVGVPIGIAAGRLMWRRLANDFPVVYVPPVALLVLVLVVPAAIVLANVLAALPARAAARIRPAEALRTE